MPFIKQTIRPFVILAFLVFIVGASKQARAESTAGTLPHKTDFLALPACGSNCGTTYFPTGTASQRSAYISSLKSNGYTHAYLSVTASGFNFYGNPTGYNSLLNELEVAGIKPVVWLTSDTGTWKDKSLTEIKNDLSAFIPAIDSNVNSYVVGLEANEYWTSTEIQDIGNHMDSLTAKPLAAHQTPGKWDYCLQGWCDYMILQANNPTQSTTATAVGDKVISAREGLNFSKPVVAGEYCKGGTGCNPKTLGDGGLAQCAAGFGNGGTPSNIKWPTGQDKLGNSCAEGGSLPTPSPTPSASPGSSPSPSPSNQPPQIQNSSLTAVSGQPTDMIFSYTDPDGPGPYTFTITQVPAHGSLTGAPTDNDWIYTSTPGYVGTDLFRWRVNDGLVNSTTATVNITVVAAPAPSPSATPGFAKGDVNHDTLVNANDMQKVLLNFGKQPSQVTNYFDPVGDAKINSWDFGYIRKDWQ
jgi:hypothetical protein